MQKRQLILRRLEIRGVIWATLRLSSMPMFGLLVAALLSGAALSRVKKGKLSTAARASADAREERIKSEIARIGSHEWAGQYYYGDGLGVNVALHVAPESGFVFTWHGCLGLYDLNYGNVRFEDGLLKLNFTYRNRRSGFSGIAPEFYPVRWGDRHYLIPSDGVIEFCNAVNAGLEPCSWLCARFLLRRGDKEKESAGRPEVPAEFRQYLLPDPLKANIAIVEQSRVVRDREVTALKFRVSTVVLDAGKAEGVLVGLELHSYDPPNAETAEVIEVQEHTSRARIVQVGTEGEKPKAGWRLSTRLIDRALTPK